MNLNHRQISSHNQMLTAALAIITSITTMAGCSSQYNGAWTFSDFSTNDRKVIKQAQQYHASRSGKPGFNDPNHSNRQDAASQGAFSTTGTPRGAQYKPNNQFTSYDPTGDRTGAQFTQNNINSNQINQVAAVRPEYRDGRRDRHKPLGLYGHLPTTSTVRDSSMSNPQGVLQITFANEGADFDPELDPTGKKMIYASTRHRENADIYIQAIGSTTVTQLTDDPAKDIMPTFSPSGTHVAFASNRSGNWDIYLMDVKGGKAQQVTNNPTHDVHPSFSPDGKSLVFSSYGARSGQWELVVINIANPASRKIIAHGLFPQWSPKGDKILFQRARERGTRWFSVWTVDYENGDAKRATEIIAANNAATITPSWGPNGNHIVFSTVVTNDLVKGNNPENADIWVIGIDGTNRINLTNSNFANLQPTWSKDGKIYFVSNRGNDSMENIWSISPDQAMRLAKPFKAVPDMTVKAPEKAPAPISPDSTVNKSEKGGRTAAVKTNN